MFMLWLQKLAFAAQLADEFSHRISEQEAEQNARADFRLTNLVWLIQRDFLEGKTVRELVQEALAPVDNPTNDRHVTALNGVRESLTGGFVRVRI